MSGSRRVARQSAWRVLAIPAALSLISLAGLVIGLTGQGWRDGLAVLLLLIPIVLFVRHWLQRQ